MNDLYFLVSWSPSGESLAFRAHLDPADHGPFEMSDLYTLHLPDRTLNEILDFSADLDIHWKRR